MKPVTLIFPDNLTLADFLIKEKISNVLVSSNDQSITAPLTDKQIDRATDDYLAWLKPMKERD